MSSIDERALTLLSSGVDQESTAKALGVTASYISQLMAQDDFRAKVIEARFMNAQKHNDIDNKYDTLEEKLLEQLEQSVPLLMKPQEISRVLQTVNGAKRRGTSAPETLHSQQPVVQLTIPAQVIQKFTVNIDNMVVQAGQQNLVTMQSATLLKQIKETSQKEKQHEQLTGVPAT